MKTVATEECTCGTVPQVRLVNTSGAAVTLGGIGAAIMAVEVPDRNGKLADVAPSILHIMGLPQPAEMTGHDLITD